jgi:beta-glucosidase-like glycosyl hydrolase
LKYDAKVSPADLGNTFLPAFHATVSDGEVASVMCSYNAINGNYGCAGHIYFAHVSSWFGMCGEVCYALRVPCCWR